MQRCPRGSEVSLTALFTTMETVKTQVCIRCERANMDHVAWNITQQSEKDSEMQFRGEGTENRKEVKRRARAGGPGCAPSSRRRKQNGRSPAQRKAKVGFSGWHAPPDSRWEDSIDSLKLRELLSYLFLVNTSYFYEDVCGLTCAL